MRTTHTLKIGSVFLLVDPPLAYTCSIWPDGLVVPAMPGIEPEYRERALSLGYRDTGPEAWETAEAQMCREHEAIHHLTAVRLDGLPWSPTLRAVAEGREYPLDHAEEARVMEFQRMLNQPPSRCPPGWRALRAEAIALLRG